MRHCIRCGVDFEYEEEVSLCPSCNSKIKQAIALVETDQKVKEFYDEFIEQQELAEVQLEVRMERLKKVFNDEKDGKVRAIKKVGKAAKGFYTFSPLKYGISSVKKVAKKADTPLTEIQELEIEINELKQLIEADPIELVVYEFIENQELRDAERKEELKDREQSGLLRLLYHRFELKFASWEKEKQVKSTVYFVIITGIVLIGVNLFLFWR